MSVFKMSAAESDRYLRFFEKQTPICGEWRLDPVALRYCHPDGRMINIEDVLTDRPLLEALNALPEVPA